ncbi:hypothetical protein [Marinomonas posidonica]|uniref:Uncharacterized protein n=1 Tax=Marinomonas posidonica (strain CECT 7376 / NCIMB 14433 / IVIA-Po-181) TaxID=491952 RepID=F6CS78_MARPP|nr:hypothetical protein [Marinomonas posidonica]AEF53865.1 hypothetical protein Mar181_0811 [Marinomonas posidonica IVIA-Po-181]
MNTLHSPFGAPRKELINGLHKTVVILLFFLLLAFAGLYYLVNTNLQQQNAKQEQLTELLGLVHSAEEHWLEWLLVEDLKAIDGNLNTSPASHFHQILTSEYKLIQDQLVGFDDVQEADISGAMALLIAFSGRELDTYPLSNQERIQAYQEFEKLESLGDRLMQISVALDYQRELFVGRMVWAPVGLFVVIVLVVIVLAARLNRQLTSGFATIHHVIDHRKHGHASVLPERPLVDELTDLSHLIDHEISSRDMDIRQQLGRLSLIDEAMSVIELPFFMVNEERDIVWQTQGAERLWNKNSQFFESMFGIDPGLDSPVGEQVSESILLSDEALRLSLSDGVYELTVRQFKVQGEESSMRYLIQVQHKSETAEFDVLYNSLKLMSKDVWDAPIRLLRENSPYAIFAHSLEEIRVKVADVIRASNKFVMTTDQAGKITKLQQIASLIDAKTDHNDSEVERPLPVVSVPVPELSVHQVMDLSDQIQDSLLLGYEMVIQRLLLVEKDLSSNVILLESVSRCLNEVRAGVLSSLAATEGESDAIRHRFAVDLDHDISEVQGQVQEMSSLIGTTLSLLESDRSVGNARLMRVRETVEDIVKRIEIITTETSAELEDKSQKSVDDDLDEEWEEW